MGIYLNPGSMSFQMSINDKIYVDKTGLIRLTNECLGTSRRYICVSRPRRFGKSVAADMLSAYYGFGEDGESLFADLKIAEDESFHEHLNQYNVIKVDMQEFMSITANVNELLNVLKKYISAELLHEYPDVFCIDKENLNILMTSIMKETGKQFVILIDEWDCVMRRSHSQEDKKRYLDFLRNLMKDKPYIALAYMTGILPIKKYGEHSTLNMFEEYSMTYESDISQYFGFTDEEVKVLCQEYNMNFEEVKMWYDGYHLLSYESGQRQEYSMYNPRSVSLALTNKRYKTYWNSTETFSALKDFIVVNFDGLKEAVTAMLAGESIAINPYTFQNDMTELHSRDDVMTLLVHLGYLAYDQDNQTVSIPNKEVSMEFINSIETGEKYQEVAKAVKASNDLLKALWEGDSERVAKGVDEAHEEIAILKYNDENSLSCAIGLSFYYAREYYTMIRELPTGKGFADIVCIPRPMHPDKPAVVIELKWDKEADTAIKQIKAKNYLASLKGYEENTILCGITYDKETKKHSCIIEKA